MTAYLQPGDKIHITVPGDFGYATQQKRLGQIVAAYKKLGIEVFQATSVIHSEQVTVVSVVRPPRVAAPMSMPGKLKPVETLPPLQARWPGPHPGYPDHPRVP